MIPCWCGLPNSFQGGPLPGKDEAEKDRLQGKFTHAWRETGRDVHARADSGHPPLDSPSLLSPAPAATFRKRDTSSFPILCQNYSLPFAPLPVRTRGPSPAHPSLQQHSLMQATVHHHPHAASRRGAKASSPSLPHASNTHARPCTDTPLDVLTQANMCALGRGKGRPAWGAARSPAYPTGEGCRVGAPGSTLPAPAPP